VLIHTSNNTEKDNVHSTNNDTAHTPFLGQINTNNEEKGKKDPITVISNPVTSESELGQKDIKNKTKLTEDEDKE
jgi:hypothetical protein